MARVEHQAPGWYPDPDDNTGVRYWNGSAWTSERRPRPGWSSPGGAGGAAGAAGSGGAASDSYLRTWGPGVRRPKIGWIIASIVAVAAALGWTLSLTVLKGHDAGPRTITDASFIAAANQVCKDQLTPLIHADRPQVGDNDQTVANLTDAAATGLDHLIANLRRLAVQPADQGRVSTWLDNWSTYAATGHQVASAVRLSDPSKYEPLLEQGRKQRWPVVDFATANGIKSCAF